VRLTVLGLALFLGSAAAAQPIAPIADTAQISTPAGKADVGAGEITTGAGDAATPPAQLTRPARRADAPADLSARQQGRNLALPQVKGRDRCDPAAGAGADTATCVRIMQDQSAWPPAPSSTPAVTVNPNATPAGLVNDIVNGGTGSVVVLSPKDDPPSGR